MPPSDDLRAVLDETISGAVGAPFRSTRLSGQAGGSISQSMVVEDGRQRFFVKLNDASLDGMFVAEADGLAALARCPAIRVPKVIARGTSGDKSFKLKVVDMSALGALAGLELLAGRLA